jgi:hypothetical protein
MDTFFPGPVFTPLSPAPDFKQTGKRFEGRYYQTRTDYTTAAKSAHMLDYEEVFIDNEGYLIIYGQKMVQIEGLLFCAYNDNYTILFIENTRGKITHLVYGYEPVFSMEKQTIINSLEFSIVYSSICLLTLLGSVIYLIIDKKQVQSRNKEIQQSSPVKVTFYLSTSLVSLFIVDFFIFMSLLLMSVNNDMLLNTLNILTVIPIVLTVLSSIFLLLVIYLWISKKSSLKSKLLYICQLIFICLYLWFLIYWNWLRIPF